MRSNDISRRALLGTALAVPVMALAPAPAAALTEAEATALIRQVVQETMQVINSNTSDARALANFEKILAKYGDIAVVARSVLGQPWRSASAAQQRAFVSAFQGYIARKYGGEFREYRGATMQVVGASNQGNKGILVRSMVEYTGQSPFPIDWQVSDRSGSPKLFNIFIEGISMLSTERSEVRAIFESNGSNLDRTIADLNSRG